MREVVVEGDLEGETDEGVREREEEVCERGSEQSPEDKLVEMQWSMALGNKEFSVNWEILQKSVSFHIGVGGRCIQTRN